MAVSALQAVLETLTRAMNHSFNRLYFSVPYGFLINDFDFVTLLSINYFLFFSQTKAKLTVAQLRELYLMYKFQFL